MSVRKVVASVLAKFAQDNGCTGGFEAKGYTTLKAKLEGRDEIFCCATSFGGKGSWNDWALVDYENDDGETVTYPARIEGIFKFTSLVIDGFKPDQEFAVIHSSSDQVPMTRLENRNLLLSTVLEEQRKTPQWYQFRALLILCMCLRITED